MYKNNDGKLDSLLEPFLQELGLKEVVSNGNVTQACLFRCMPFGHGSLKSTKYV